MYMVSHIMGEPKSPEEISPVTHIPPHQIRQLYQLIYPRRDELVSDELLMEPAARSNAQGVFEMLLNKATVEAMLRFCPLLAAVTGSPKLTPKQ